MTLFNYTVLQKELLARQTESSQTETGKEKSSSEVYFLVIQNTLQNLVIFM